MLTSSFPLRPNSEPPLVSMNMSHDTYRGLCACTLILLNLFLKHFSCLSCFLWMKRWISKFVAHVIYLSIQKLDFWWSLSSPCWPNYEGCFFLKKESHLLLSCSQWVYFVTSRLFLVFLMTLNLAELLSASDKLLVFWVPFQNRFLFRATAAINTVEG